MEHFERLGLFDLTKDFAAESDSFELPSTVTHKAPNDIDWQDDLDKQGKNVVKNDDLAVANDEKTSKKVHDLCSESMST